MKENQKNSRSEYPAWFQFLARFPPFSWFLYWQTRRLVRREMASEHDMTDSRVEGVEIADEENRLEQIVRSVVEDLGYIAAFLAPYEQGDVLPIRAFYIRHDVITEERLRQIEKDVSELAGRPLSIHDPEIARVYRYNEHYRDNLSIRAVEKQKPVTDEDLFSLFVPVVPESARPIIRGIQDELAIKEVVAVPFTIDYHYENPDYGNENEQPLLREVVGNLFAVKTSSITPQDINILRAFGYQAAAALKHNYYKTRTQITQNLISNIQRKFHSQKQIMSEIVSGIVHDLEYVGACIAMVNATDNLRVEAFYLDDDEQSPENLDRLRDLLDLNSFSDLQTALQINVADTTHRSNLGYQVVTDQRALWTTGLYHLMQPLVPESAQESVNELQQKLGIYSIIGVPLMSMDTDGVTNRRVMGVLYIASRSRGFAPREIDLLKTIGEQVGYAQVYALSEQRRRTSVSFARMSVNMNASIHKLNNHLGTISPALYYTQFLNGDDEDMHNTAVELLETAEERIRAAVELLDQLPRPFIDETETKVSVLTCLKRASQKLEMELTVYNARITIETDPSIPDIYAFYEMLVEIFRILIKKAILSISRLDREGHIDIEVRHHDDTRMIHLAIHDNGIAMTPDELSSVFEIDEHTTDREIGFGLFWARDYIHSMGGNISVESRPRQGTTFMLDIPVRTETELRSLEQ